MYFFEYNSKFINDLNTTLQYVFVMFKKDRSFRANNEGIIAALMSTIFFIVNLASCQPVWIKTKNPNLWIIQETANVCIDVSSEQVSKVLTAIKGWDSAIGTWKHLQPQLGIDDSCDYTIKEVIPPIFKNSNALAMTSAIGGHEIELYQGRYEADTLTVVLHELGHAFGARHLEGTLMAPKLTTNTYLCPDAATVAQVAVANNIDPGFFSWCLPY